MSVHPDSLSVAPPVAVHAETHGEAVRHPLAVLADPRGAAAEQFRLLAVRVATAARTRALGVLAVTSPESGAGVTVVAANLAAALGDRERVLLVDGNLRRPAVRDLFGLGPGGGALGDVLAGRASLGEATWKLADRHLYLLPGGGDVAPAQTRVLAALLGEVRSSFDRVIVDAPPILPLADVPELAAGCDAAIVVVRAGRTPRVVVSRALDMLAPLPLLGTVLNGVDPRAGRVTRELGRFDSRWRRRPAAG